MARARIARDKLYERAWPSAGEIRIKVEAAQRLAEVTVAQQQRLADYARRSLQDQAAGRRRANGRPPAAIKAKTKVVRQRARLARAQAGGTVRLCNPRPIPSAAARASLTDPASRLMLGKHGGYVQGYNVQITCSRNQVLLAIELHDNPSDTTALIPVIRRAQHNCATAGLTSDVAAWLANSGYASTANFTALADLPLLVSLTKEYDQIRATTSPSHDIPAGHRDMATRLASTEGKQAALRPPRRPVEPGFAQLFQRFGRPNSSPTGRGSAHLGRQGDKSWVTGDCHAQICESREVRLLPATRPSQRGKTAPDVPVLYFRRALSHPVSSWRYPVGRAGSASGLRECQDRIW